MSEEVYPVTKMKAKDLSPEALQVATRMWESGEIPNKRNQHYLKLRGTRYSTTQHHGIEQLTRATKDVIRITAYELDEFAQQREHAAHHAGAMAERARLRAKAQGHLDKCNENAETAPDGTDRLEWEENAYSWQRFITVMFDKE